jgi:hypothetical protein
VNSHAEVEPTRIGLSVGVLDSQDSYGSDLISSTCKLVDLADLIFHSRLQWKSQLEQCSNTSFAASITETQSSVEPPHRRNSRRKWQL